MLNNNELDAIKGGAGPKTDTPSLCAFISCEGYGCGTDICPPDDRDSPSLFATPDSCVSG